MEIDITEDKVIGETIVSRRLPYLLWLSLTPWPLRVRCTSVKGEAGGTVRGREQRVVSLYSHHIDPPHATDAAAKTGTV